ncbi:hypothetical protein K5E_21820 [Enterococcus thailandicus]|nr:hypothetical protein K4E_00270 [Enterococcus thailandicus]GMC10043.1 hypothetical protein K5E_21820 [Enterococcus thailandicus]
MKKEPKRKRSIPKLVRFTKEEAAILEIAIPSFKFLTMSS